jgi:hypothetical protein
MINFNTKLQPLHGSSEIIEPTGIINVEEISAEIGRKPVATKRRASTDSQKIGKRSKGNQIRVQAYKSSFA